MSGRKAPNNQTKRSPAVAHGRAEHLVFFWIAAALVGLVIFGRWQYALVALGVMGVAWVAVRLTRKR